MERAVDRAIEILFEGLNEEHYGNRLQAAKEFLRAKGAHKRGFGPQGTRSSSRAALAKRSPSPGFLR
jgi:hypothetical protein